ncbi:hypothetical protein CCANI_08785 [Corynebacterium canis]|nr:hypothetical protein CCANI_08785 [Corynebacterium canis]
MCDVLLDYIFGFPVLLVALVFVLAQGYVFASATLVACVCGDASWVDRIQLPDVFQCSVIAHADSLWWRKLQNGTDAAEGHPAAAESTHATHPLAAPLKPELIPPFGGGMSKLTNHDYSYVYALFAYLARGPG